MAEKRIYKLGGIDVYDLDGKPHYAANNRPLVMGASGPLPPREIKRIEIPRTNDEGLTMDEVRVNANKIEQKGRNLGAPRFPLGELPKYLSEALPTTAAGERQQSPSLDIDYSGEDAAVMGRSQGDNDKIAGGGSVETLIEPSVPGTTGRSDSAQEGISDKPDRADRISRIEEATSNVKATYTPNARARAKAAFLDPNNRGYNAIRARDAAVGANLEGIKGGHSFKDGMSAEARYELSGGDFENKEAAEAFVKKYINVKQPTKAETPASSGESAKVSTDSDAVVTPTAANTQAINPDPQITDSSAPHPHTGLKPSAATEASNKEYGAMKFVFDAAKGMMVPVK